MTVDSFDKQRKRNASGESTTSTDSMSNYIPTPPDGGWGWVIVFASFMNHVIVDGITFTFGVFYLQFLETFKEGKGKTALVGSLLAGFYLMTGPIASALVNRYGCRPVCVAGSLISSCAFVLATFSPNLNMLMMTYGVMGGFGFGLMYLPSIISVSYYFERKRALATGIAVCGAGVGGFIFAPAGRLLMETFNWKNGLYIIAGIVMIGSLCGALMRPLEPPKKKKPRQKNFFDRCKEKMFERSQSVDASTSNAVNTNIMQGLEEAKLAREKQLHESESEWEVGSTPIITPGKSAQEINSPSNTKVTIVTPGSDTPVSHNSLSSMPTITVQGVSTEQINEEDEDKEDEANVQEDTEQAKMLVKSPSKEMCNVDGPPISKGPLKALPPHMLREMKNKNTSLPNCNMDFKNVEESNKLLQPQLALADDPETAKCMSMSAGHVLLATPRRRRKRPEGVEKEDYARPLYRRDIFYSGSVLHIPQFRSQPDVNTYVKSITEIPAEVAPEKEGKCWSCLPVPKTAKDVLKQMLDFSLLADPTFLVACLGEVFGFIGLFVPFVFIAQRSIALGVPETKAAFLLSVIGITNTIGRILSGWLADFRWVNPLLFHNIMMILGGVFCICNMFCTTYPMMIAFAALFGFSVAVYISLTSIILCELMGLEKLTSAFGFLTMVRGVASIAGPPAAGFVFDLTGNYDMSFHVGGVMFILAGIFYSFLHLPYFRRRQPKRIDVEEPSDNVFAPVVTVEAPAEDADISDSERKPKVVTIQVCDNSPGSGEASEV